MMCLMQPQADGVLFKGFSTHFCGHAAFVQRHKPSKVPICMAQDHNCHPHTGIVFGHPHFGFSGFSAALRPKGLTTRSRRGL